MQCMLLRAFNYLSRDIQKACSLISDLIRDTEGSKVVLIAHGQRAAAAGMVLDWLYATSEDMRSRN